MKENNVIILLSSYCRAKFILPVIFTLLTLAHIAPALGESPPIGPSAGFPVPQEEDNSFKPHKSHQQLERYLKDKYKEISDAETSVRQTSHGPAGEVRFRGSIVPREIAESDLAALPDRHAKSRAIAKAFMEDEADLLGIDKPNELRVFNISTSKGGDGDYTHIIYRKYINDIEYQGLGMQIIVGPNYNIWSVGATFGPVSPEVYEATKKKALTEKEVRAIIDNDLTEDEKSDFERSNGGMTFRKLAIASPPYVIWVVSFSYEYTIDAFTGKILKKESAIMPFNPHYDRQKIERKTPQINNERQVLIN